MVSVISETEQKARKPHRCADCDQEIKVGETYTRQFNTDGYGEFWTYKAHSDCMKASWEIFRMAKLHYSDEWNGFANAASECTEWKRDVSKFLRSRPEYIEVRKRFILTKLRWRQSYLNYRSPTKKAL